MSVSLGSRAICGGVYNRHMGQPDGIGYEHMFFKPIITHIDFCIYKNLHIPPPGPHIEGR